MWRRFLVLGPQKFGDVRYLGKAPVPGREGLFDVLVATYNVTESLLYFEPTTGQLVAMEMFPDSGDGPVRAAVRRLSPGEWQIVPAFDCGATRRHGDFGMASGTSQNVGRAPCPSGKYDFSVQTQISRRALAPVCGASPFQPGHTPAADRA